MDRLLTPPEVAELLAVPVSWVYAAARSGRLPSIPIGRYRRFSEAAIKDWAGTTQRYRGSP
jgi:excisionase family DNA binding protein